MKNILKSSGFKKPNLEFYKKKLFGHSLNLKNKFGIKSIITVETRTKKNKKYWVSLKNEKELRYNQSGVKGFFEDSSASINDLSWSAGGLVKFKDEEKAGEVGKNVEEKRLSKIQNNIDKLKKNGIKVKKIGKSFYIKKGDMVLTFSGFNNSKNNLFFVKESEVKKDINSEDRRSWIKSNPNGWFLQKFDEYDLENLSEDFYYPRIENILDALRRVL